MKRRRKTDKGTDSVVITTDDGTRFRCSVASLGRETEPVWMLIDDNGQQFVGPAVAVDKSPDAVRQLINDWWKAKPAEPPPQASGRRS